MLGVDECREVDRRYGGIAVAVAVGIADSPLVRMGFAGSRSEAEGDANNLGGGGGDIWNGSGRQER